MPRQRGKQPLLQISTENNAAPRHLGFITPTLRGKTAGSCHAPGDETNLFLWSTALLSVWDMSVNEESREGNIKDIGKLFSFPQSGSSQRDESIESRLLAI